MSLLHGCITTVYSKSGYSGGVNMWKPPSRAGSISSLSSIPTPVSVILAMSFLFCRVALETVMHTLQLVTFTYLMARFIELHVKIKRDF